MKERNLWRRAVSGGILAFGLGLCRPLPTLAEEVDLERGKKVYDLRCRSCHGTMGKGDGVQAKDLNKQPRDLTQPGFLAGRTDDDLKQTIREGKNPMPAFKAQLRSKDIEEVIQYIRSLAAKE